MRPRFSAAQSARSILGQRALERLTVLVTNRVTLSNGEDFTEGYRELGVGSDLDTAVRNLLQQSGR